MKFGTVVWNLTEKIPFVEGENPLTVSPIFTQNWHLHNAFSMRMLKHFSGVVCGPIIAVHGSNDIPWLGLGLFNVKMEVKRGVAQIT